MKQRFVKMLECALYVETLPFSIYWTLSYFVWRSWEFRIYPCMQHYTQKNKTQKQRILNNILHEMWAAPPRCSRWRSPTSSHQRLPCKFSISPASFKSHAWCSSEPCPAWKGAQEVRERSSVFPCVSMYIRLCRTEAAINRWVQLSRPSAGARKGLSSKSMVGMVQRKHCPSCQH